MALRSYSGWQVTESLLHFDPNTKDIFFSLDFIYFLNLNMCSFNSSGVEDAFLYTPKVMTVSLHKHCHGFFPG